MLTFIELNQSRHYNVIHRIIECLGWIRNILLLKIPGAENLGKNNYFMYLPRSVGVGNVSENVQCIDLEMSPIPGQISSDCNLVSKPLYHCTG